MLEENDSKIQIYYLKNWFLSDVYLFSTIQKRAGAFAVVQLLFYVNFKSTCSDSCIDTAGVLLEAALPNRVKKDSIILNNITVVDDDEKEFGTIISIPVTGLEYLSFIGEISSIFISTLFYRFALCIGKKKSKKVKTTKGATATVTAKTRTTTTTTVSTTATTTTATSTKIATTITTGK